MTSKLTLSINKKTIYGAKKISKKNGKSVSKMVEEYLNQIIERESIKYSPLEEIKKIVQRHKTTMALPADGNYKKLLRKMKYEDYLKSSKEK